MTLFTAFGQFAGSGGAAPGFGLEFITRQTWSAVSSVSFDNLFSSEYDNYHLMIESSNSFGLSLLIARLRSGGVDNSAANSYANQDLFASGTTVSGSQGKFNQGNIGQELNVTSINEVIVSSPFLAAATSWSTLTMHQEVGATWVGFGVTHQVAASFDGLTLSTGSGTTTGRIDVYGYKKAV